MIHIINQRSKLEIVDTSEAISLSIHSFADQKTLRKTSLSLGGILPETKNMSSSRIFLVGNSIFRPQNLSSFPLSLNRFPSVSLRFRCFSNETATAAAAATVDSDSPSPHPWPEWINFVDRLKTKGYFTKNIEDDTVYQEMNLVKDACLSFARDRYDVLRSKKSSHLSHHKRSYYLCRYCPFDFQILVVERYTSSRGAWMP